VQGEKNIAGMVRMRLIDLILAIAVAVVAAGCSNTRFLTDDQLLYTGKKEVYLGDSGTIKDLRVKRLTEPVTAYKPNNSVGGKRMLPPVGLWVYNYRKPDESKESPGWLYRSLAKEPVLISTVNPDVRCRKLESELFGSGYFHASVWFETENDPKNPKKATITYFVRPGRPFRYDRITFAPPEDAVDSIINSYEPKLIIKHDALFDLGQIKSEAKGITDKVLEEGYFFFNQADVKYTADTTNVPGMMDLMIGKNNDIIQNGGRKYFIDDVTVRIISQTDSFGFQSPEDTVRFNGINIISRDRRFNPEIFTRSIYFRTGDAYSASRHRKTITHLNSYGIFKFINFRYTPDRDTLVNEIDMLIELTPMKDISLDLEANVVTKSTGFSGPGLAATLSHGNVGKGANKLQLKLNGGVEWQWTNQSASTLGTTSYNVGLSSSIIFPRLLIPRKLIKPGRFNLPQTSVTLGFEFLNKVQYYRMSSVNLGFGYQWKKPDKITQTFYPVFINSIALLKTTPEFDSILVANPYIRKSFEEQFIVGMKYDFIFDNSLTKARNGFYFQGGVSTAGNLLDAVKRASSSELERPYFVAGNIYSQFLKLTTDIRYYRNFHNNSLVFRLYSGVGFPYSNSVVMPYVEQFYSGGSNSIRSFIARSLGPGSLPPPENSDIIDQTGDIKLEGNVEFRFKMSKVLYGAFFLEAGNVWLMNPDESRPGAEFSFSTFTKQLAAGTGFGIRFDFNFFVLRTDFGFPLRTPYTVNDSYWTASRGDFLSGMVFNLAIGYPF
jgi:outer membrane protein assembly factor BamA